MWMVLRQSLGLILTGVGIGTLGEIAAGHGDTRSYSVRRLVGVSCG
jgi:hypothetical protein